MKLRHTEIALLAGERWLDGILAHHPEVPGIVLILERSGANLAAKRGAFIARAFEAAGYATLHIGLLSHEEHRHAGDVWNQVAALAARLAAIVEWIRHQPALKNLPLGIVGRAAAAAAMIRVATRAGQQLRALASRAGRPDFAGLEPLRSLSLPTILVVGERDAETLGPNRAVFELLLCPKELAVVPGASHAFEEPGTLDQATQALVRWFDRWLKASE